MAVTEIALEYVVVTSPDGKILITPVWRFLLGEDEDERNFLRQKILGIDAVTGELIWKNGERPCEQSVKQRDRLTSYAAVAGDVLPIFRETHLL